MFSMYMVIIWMYVGNMYVICMYISDVINLLISNYQAHLPLLVKFKACHVWVTMTMKQQPLRKGHVLQMQRKQHANVMEVRCSIEANLSFSLLKTLC